MTRYPRSWFVVADGARARILARHRDGAFEKVSEIVSASAHRPSREIGSDRPGRTFESTGNGRHALTPRNDPHQHDKIEFARLIAGEVNKAGDRDQFDNLVLAAPPRTLGEIKQHLTGIAAERLHFELAKDLTKLPEGELRERLSTIGMLPIAI